MLYENYLGSDVNYVVSELTQEHPEKAVVAIEEGMFTTLEYLAHRIKVWYDPETKLVIDITTG